MILKTNATIHTGNKEATPFTNFSPQKNIIPCVNRGLYFTKEVSIVLYHSKGFKKFRGEISFPEIFIAHQLLMKGYGCFYSFNNIFT